MLSTSLSSNNIKGEVNVDGDKSISHRALILASQSIGETHITGLLESEDIMSTKTSLQGLGVSINKEPDNSWRVIGVEPVIIRSGEYKAAPNIFETPTKNQIKVIQELINEAHNMFLQMVGESRTNLSLEKIKRLSDGRVYSGATALKEGLVDEIGDEYTAQQWLVVNKKLPTDIPIRIYNLEKASLLSSMSTAKAFIASVFLGKNRETSVHLSNVKKSLFYLSN